MSRSPNSPISSETDRPADRRSALADVGRRALVLVVSGGLLFVLMLGIGLLLTRTAIGAAWAAPTSRWLVLALAVVAVLAVGGARIYRAAHHPSDVLGGALLGIGWLLVTTRAVSPGPLRPAGPAGRQPRSTGTG